MSGSVVVMNLGGNEVLGHVSVQHAITNVIKGKYRIIESVVGEAFGNFPLPKVVELTKYLYAKWKYSRKGEVPYSRIGVLRRDDFTCAYCGTKGTRATMTVDHVIPRSRWLSSGMNGTPTNWNNMVASCQPCNNKKSNKTPKEAGMKLLFNPSTPTFSDAYRWSHDKK